MTVWNVNTEATLRSAIKQSAAGDTIMVRAGDYHISMRESGIHDIKISKSLNIAGDGGRANFYADNHPVEKGIFSLVLDKTETVSFSNIGFVGAQNSTNNGAGIRQNGGNLTVDNSYFGNSDNGILSITHDEAARGDVKVTNSEFNGLGTNGFSHAMYVLADDFIVKGNNIHDTLVGHHVKSLSANTVVSGNILNDGAGTSSYAVDVEAGGNVLIDGNTIIQGANGENPGMISYAAARFGGVAGVVVIQNNHIQDLSANPLTKLLGNRTDSVVQILNNTVEGVAEHKLATGLFYQQGNVLDGVALKSYGANHNAVMGTAGKDYMVALAGYKDVLPLDAGAGNDTIFGNTGNDLIFAGSGNDFAYGHKNTNYVYGQDGNDILLGGADKDFIFGGAGEDIVFDISGVNVLWGGRGNDLVFGAGTDEVDGNGGNDFVIDSGSGVEGGRINGGDGNDILYGRLGEDQPHGGKGVDIAVYEGNSSDYTVTKKFGVVHVNNIVAANLDSDTGNGAEMLDAIEKIQFSNGYLDTATNVFHEGGQLFDFQAFVNSVGVLDALSFNSIHAAPLDAAPILQSVYISLFDLLA